MNKCCSCDALNLDPNSKDEKKHHVKITFLESTLDQKYDWPRRRDISCVATKFVFHGPLTIYGHGPFDMAATETSTVQKKYDQMRSGSSR